MEAHSLTNLKTIMKTPSSPSSPSPSLPGSTLIPAREANPAETTLEITKQLQPNFEGSFLISTGQIFPPPITILRTINKGNPYEILRFDESTKSWFVEKKNGNPKREILKAYREDGRLKLYFVQSDDEDEKEM